MSGEIAPGTVLRQEQLSEQFQVSRTPSVKRCAGWRRSGSSRSSPTAASACGHCRATSYARRSSSGRSSRASRPSWRRRGSPTRGWPSSTRPRSCSAELTLELRKRAREGTQDGALRRELGAREPCVPRRDLRRRQRSVRRAAGEERPAQLLHARRLGRRARHRPPVRAERLQHRAIREAIAAGSVQRRPPARPRARARLGPDAGDDPGPGAGQAVGRAALRSGRTRRRRASQRRARP